MGGKPSKRTPAGKRLKAKKAAPAKSASPKFGSPEYNAKYGVKPLPNKKK